MAERIPQSVTIRVPLQAFLASDHVSPATGLTIVVTISKNGGAYGNPSAGATTAVEIANGSYYADLSTTDTGTVGPLFVRGAVATMDPITSIYNVVAFVEQTGDAFARLGAPVGASHSADVAAVKALLPTALVSGRMDASVGAYQTGLTPLQPATAGRTLVVDASGLADANMVKLGPTGAGTAQTARDIGLSVLLASGTGTGQLDFTSGVVKANATQWLGGTIPAVNVTGVPLVDLKYTLGTISPATAGSVRADAVTSYGTLVADTATAVWAAGTRSLTTFGTLVADIATAVWSAVARTVTGTVTLAASQPNYAPAVAGDAMALTPSERTATANEVEAQIIDDTDSEKVLLAITNKIAAVNPDLGGLSVGAIASAAATAVWAAVTRTLTAGTNIVLAKGVGITGFNDPTAAATASAVRTELTTELARLDVATSTRASQTSVDDLPTNAEFAAGLDAADDATLAAIAALPTADAATIAAAVRDVSNSTPAAGSLGEAVRGADAKAAVLIDTIGAPAGATVGADIAQIIERTDRLPDDPADESLVIAATNALATAIANVKTDVDAIPTNPATAGGLTAALATIVAAIGGKPSADDILRSVLTEGYAVNGEPMTLEQAVHMIWSMLANKSVTGTTLTTKGLDGATPSGTFTLDKAKNPTSQVRAT